MRVPDLDPALHVSPYRLFRALAEGETPVLYDLRPRPTETLAGARPAADLDLSHEPRLEAQLEALVGNTVPDALVILFDDDGELATDTARGLQAEGNTAVRALYGGLDLYRYCLDPQVVGEERFLRPAD